ncbi:MAG: transposase [Bacteroidetes bacterium]|nr:transposase [Bacteroidota bacterium]
MEKRKKRSWSKDEKLKILKEAKEKGVEITIRAHEVYPSTFYSWQKKYLLEGESGVDDTAIRRKDKEYIRQLEDEMSILKLLLAERDLEVALQDDLLKKKYPWARKKS